MPVSPEIPVTVTSIVILEFGLALTELSRTTIRGPFRDGDSFEFPSIIEEQVLEDNDAIRILQIAVNGVNENQAPIRNSLGVVYTNACGVQPVFTIGDSIGWIVFVSSILENVLQYILAIDRLKLNRVSCFTFLSRTLLIPWLSCVRRHRLLLRCLDRLPYHRTLTYVLVLPSCLLFD
jgi:hypothetical protein